MFFNKNRNKKKSKIPKISIVAVYQFCLIEIGGNCNESCSRFANCSIRRLKEKTGESIMKL